MQNFSIQYSFNDNAFILVNSLQQGRSSTKAISEIEIRKNCAL